MSKVKNFIKEHKREIIIATIAGTVGIFGGVVCCDRYASKKYDELIKNIECFGADGKGASMLDDTVTFFKEASHSVQVLHPNGIHTISQTFSDGSGSQFLASVGYGPDTVVSGILVGIKEAKPNL